MLTEKHLWRAMTALAESREAREKGDIRGSVAWIDETITAIDCALEDLARTRKPEDDDSSSSDDEDQDDDWLTSREVSELLGWPLRTVQHHADKLGARRNGGRLFFPASAVREHIEGACA